LTRFNDQTIVALFVRRPIIGRVKTRLARDLGDEAVCELYRAMVADVIAAVAGSGMQLALFHDGTEGDLLPPEWCGAAVAVFPQEGDDLGSRMDRAFRRAFADGAAGVILIGSDIPGIDTPLLTAAREAICDHDAVFAPAEDGGYCLVAATGGRYHQGIFDTIPWSSPTVLERTLAACAAAGLSAALLEPRRDIDTLTDLTAYCRCPAPAAHRTNGWLVAHGFRTITP
jgi:rSAM/selenodomain-associated transferase 1